MPGCKSGNEKEMNSVAFMSVPAEIHSLSSEGKPFHETRYSMFLCLSQEAKISWISCSSMLRIKSSRGGRSFFWELKEGAE